MSEPKGARKLLGQILVEKGLITQGQLEEALKLQQQQPSKRLGRVLADLAYVSAEQVVAAVREQQKASWKDVKRVSPGGSGEPGGPPAGSGGSGAKS
jgi:hypothetical protein